MRLHNIIDALSPLAGLYIVRAADFETVRGSQFSVPIARCVNSYGLSFAQDKRLNPLVALLMEYKDNPLITYEQSSLLAFLNQFQPRNLQEALFGRVFDQSCRTATIEPVGSIGDVTQLYLPMPWSRHPEIQRYKRARARSKSAKVEWDTRNFKLDMDAQAKKEFARTIKCFDSIKNNGYNPDLFSRRSLSNRFIQVVLLRNCGDERAVIMSGTHRVAALSALGWDDIPAILVANGMPIVDLANVENWPVVKEALYDVDAAVRVFNRFFLDFLPL